MIKLSDMLIATLDDKDPLIALQINEVKRLEALDVPRVKAERKPLVDGGGGNFYFVVDTTRGVLITAWRLSREEAEGDAKRLSTKTGQPHTVCQVMAPESGECPTIPVATFTPTPERPHEWVVYSPLRDEHYHWLGTRYAMGEVVEWWYAGTSFREVTRFATTAEAQAYIDTHKIADAYPWPVPKLTS